MDVQIRVLGGDEVEEVTDLWEWLRGERALAGAVQPVRRPVSEGELGGVVDTLAVALGSGGAGVVLARSVTAWLSTRRSNVSVTVKTKTGTVKVDARNLDPGEVLPLLQQVLHDNDADST